MPFRTIDLCAGIGGIRKGFEMTGDYVNVLSAEVDKYACLTYEHLYGENPNNDLTSEKFKNTVENSLLSRGIDRLFLTVEDETFEDAYDSTRPVLPQIEAFAKKHSIEPKQGWKVELAKSVKQLLKNKKTTDIDEETKTKWVNLFKKFEK